MTSKEVKENDIIQLMENSKKGWAACLMIVSKVISLGVLAYLRLPSERNAYLIIPFDQFEIVGRALLVNPSVHPLLAYSDFVKI